MARPLLDSEAVLRARSWLRPARGPAPDDATERGATLADIAADPTTARCVAPIASAMRAAGVVESLSAADQALAESVLDWSRERGDALATVLRPLGEACARARVRALLCKGAALHGLLYPHPEARPSADVDVFVPARDLDRFLEAVAANGLVPAGDSVARIESFRAGGDPTIVDLAFERADLPIPIEVKCDPFGVGHPLRRLDEAAEGATPSAVYPGLLLPSAETMVLQQAFSLARRPEPDLLAHAELAGVLHVRRDELDVARLLRLVEGEGLHGILRAVFADTEAAFPGTVPPSLRRPRGDAGWTPARFRRGTLAPAARETRWTQWSLWIAHAVNGARPLDGARWMLGRLFPPTPLLALQCAGEAGRSPLARLRRIALRLRA